MFSYSSNMSCCWYQWFMCVFKKQKRQTQNYTILSCISKKYEHNYYSLLRLHNVCIDVIMLAQIQTCQQSLMMCMDLFYHCDVNTIRAQPYHGVIIVFKLLRHTLTVLVYMAHMHYTPRNTCFHISKGLISNSTFTIC